MTVGGSAVAGDTSQQAAARELFEEIGLRHDFEGVRPHLTSHFDEGFDDIYLIERDVDLSSLVLQQEEVQGVAWATEEEIIARIQAGTFIPYHEGLVSTLFALRKQRGNITSYALL